MLQNVAYYAQLQVTVYSTYKLYNYYAPKKFNISFLLSYVF